MEKKNILLVSLTDLKNDPRPYKHICALKGKYHITELARGASGNADEFFKIITPKKASILKKIYWLPFLILGNFKPYLERYAIDRKVELLRKKFDLIIVMDIMPSYLAFENWPNVPVLLDLQEYLPKQYGTLKWRVLFGKSTYNLCKEYLLQASATITISELVAEKYNQEFGLRPMVTYNTPLAENLHPSPTDCENKVTLVHHGLCVPNRHIETMFLLMDLLDKRFELHLYLVGEGKYHDKIKFLAEKHARIVWHKPVEMVNISKEINQYDIGLFMLPANSFNHDNTIANKLFEFIQARLATAVWPTKGMKFIVDKYETGFCTQNFDVQSMANKLNALTNEDIMRYKENSHKAAKVLTGEKSIEKIKQLVYSILGDNDSGKG